MIYEWSLAGGSSISNVRITSPLHVITNLSPILIQYLSSSWLHDSYILTGYNIPRTQHYRILVYREHQPGFSLFVLHPLSKVTNKLILLDISTAEFTALSLFTPYLGSVPSLTSLGSSKKAAEALRSRLGQHPQHPDGH